MYIVKETEEIDGKKCVYETLEIITWNSIWIMKKGFVSVAIERERMIEWL